MDQQKVKLIQSNVLYSLSFHRVTAPDSKQPYLHASWGQRGCVAIERDCVKQSVEHNYRTSPRSNKCNSMCNTIVTDNQLAVHQDDQMLASEEFFHLTFTCPRTFQGQKNSRFFVRFWWWHTCRLQTYNPVFHVMMFVISVPKVFL